MRAAARLAGFTLLGLMILIAILALASSATLTLGSIAQRRMAEESLLEVGAAYRRAIASYLNSSPAGNRSYPTALADLLKDPRYPNVRRHLRRLYPDPITGKAEWGLVRAPGGGIMGVHSLSEATPIKIAGFDTEEQLFEGKTRYADWLFVASLLPSGIAVGVPAVAPGVAPGVSPSAPPASSTLQLPTPSAPGSPLPAAAPSAPPASGAP